MCVWDTHVTAPHLWMQASAMGELWEGEVLVKLSLMTIYPRNKKEGLVWLCPVTLSLR